MYNWETLFSKYNLYYFLQAKDIEMYSEIDEYNSNQLLNTSTDDLIRYFTEKYEVNPIIFFEDDICVDSQEVEIERSSEYYFPELGCSFVKGIEITIDIPFKGDKELFHCVPSHFLMNTPEAIIEEGLLTISVTTSDHKNDVVKREFDNQIENIKANIVNINNDLTPWNSALPSKAETYIEKRKNKLLKDKGLISALGYPMKRRDDGFITYATPQVRRKVEPKPPTSNIKPYTPEPTLVMDEYEYILSIIKSSARLLERSPHAFKKMEEEHLRDILLVSLNSHYERQATGETFNYNGKTDIIILSEARAIFIAECKIWRGQKSLSDAIDQILSYATWRDTKLALIIFNRNKNLSNVIDKIPDTITTHNNFKKELNYSDDTFFRYIFRHKDDASRELILTILVFEVPN